MAKIVVSRPGREDQPIIALVCASAGFDNVRLRINTDYLIEQYRRITLAAENNPDRFGDVGRRQCRGRYLIQQRLEQVIVVAVDQPNVDRGPRKTARRHQPAKAGANDHDTRSITYHG
jgi:hypothetical protein